jgi:hypothetical protein
MVLDAQAQTPGVEQAKKDSFVRSGVASQGRAKFQQALLIVMQSDANSELIWAPWCYSSIDMPSLVLGVSYSRVLPFVCSSTLEYCLNDDSMEPASAKPGITVAETK